MNKEEIKKYLKENLSIGFEYGLGFSKKIVLKLEGEKISEIGFTF